MGEYGKKKEGISQVERCFSLSLSAWMKGEDSFSTEVSVSEQRRLCEKGQALFSERSYARGETFSKLYKRKGGRQKSYLCNYVKIASLYNKKSSSSSQWRRRLIDRRCGTARRSTNDITSAASSELASEKQHLPFDHATHTRCWAATAADGNQMRCLIHYLQGAWYPDCGITQECRCGKVGLISRIFPMNSLVFRDQCTVHYGTSLWI